MDDETSFENEFATAAAELRGANAPAETPAAEPSAEPSPPAPAPASQASAPAPEPAPAPAAAATPPAQLSTEELQRQLEEAASRERASAARASHNARENNQLRQQLDEMNRKLDELAAARASAPAAPTPAPAPAEPDMLTNAPDLEAAVNKRVQAIVAPLIKDVTTAKSAAEAAGKVATEVRQVVDPIAQQRVQDEIGRTHQALDERFGQAWRGTVKSEQFGQWLQTQPQWVQDTYEHATGFEDSATVLGRFYATTGFPQPSAAPTPPAPTPPAGAVTTPQQRLRQAAGIVTRAAAAAPAAPAADDFEGNFAIATQQLKRA
mgnify:FL=1